VYAKTAQYYDAIYAALGKDYARESDRLRRIIEHHKRSPGHALLDVACGTGGHIDHLKRHYAVQRHRLHAHGSQTVSDAASGR
jgi:ubiquinone/menaquinone biosynthesis C-methylase UbiE